MEIKGKVHCFFEQSGTFKNEFKKLGYTAYDYDIQNNFNQTDFIIDLFEERSMISPDYARNWICDFILGKYQAEISGPTLFDFEDFIQ